ncbi:hypothetical protein AAFC00_002130 [Neodothiora populina]|uniref:Ribosomal protein/NADH dehydrogenase domain-containing protein n=1 Tax=Neodothiora populina TaxID=2781224 RepID=A0ABR3PGN0_9PEZI
MVSLLQRTRKLQTLLAIKLGPGAAILPKDISRIHMRFAQRNDGGHMGPRKFWRHELVRLKFHNPAIPMTIDRTCAPSDPAIMTIHYAPTDAIQTSSSPTSSPAPSSSTSGDTAASDYTPTTRSESILMTNKSSAEIWREVARVTRAVQVEATPEEKETLEKLQEQRLKSERDSALSREVREAKKREQDLLAQARGDMSAAAA